MHEMVVPTLAQDVFQNTVVNMARTLFWPIQLLALLVIFVAYRRYPRSFMLFLLLSHVFSLIHYGLAESAVHCWLSNTFGLDPFLAQAVYGQIAFLLYFATRTTAVVLCGWYLIETRTGFRQQRAVQ